MSHQSSMYLTRVIKTNWFQSNCEYYEFFTSVSDYRTQVWQPTKYFWIKIEATSDENLDNNNSNLCFRKVFLWKNMKLPLSMLFP